MTDNEIIKFIEHAINSAKGEDGFKEIYWEKLEYILNFINRQKVIIEKSEKVEQFANKTIETANAEIEKLNIELQSMRSAANSYKMHYEKAQTEINKLKQENDFFRKTITENVQRALEVTVEEIEKAKSEAIKELADKITEVFRRYAHLHTHAKGARTDYIETFDLTEIEMQSVWDVLTLKKNDMAEYEEMGRLQKNIEIIAP